MFALWVCVIIGILVFGAMAVAMFKFRHSKGAVPDKDFTHSTRLEVIWVTMLQQNVPRHLLGRVTSLDWLISLGLVPLSFAVTGPVSEVFGASLTMVGAAVIGSVLMISLFFVPGVRDPEQEDFAERSRAEGAAAAPAD